MFSSYKSAIDCIYIYIKDQARCTNYEAMDDTDSPTDERSLTSRGLICSYDERTGKVLLAWKNQGVQCTISREHTQKKNKSPADENLTKPQVSALQNEITDKAQPAPAVHLKIMIGCEKLPDS